LQRAEHDKRSAAGGARAGYAIIFIAGDIQGKQHGYFGPSPRKVQ